MKTIWNIAATLALANLLALAGLVAWLGATGRLDDSRVHAVRQVFAKTVDQERQARIEEAALASRAAQERVEAERMARPPIPAAVQIADDQEHAQVAQQSALRRERELESLRVGLFRQQKELEERETKLRTERAEFEARIRRFAEIEGTEQFKAALATLQGQKPKDAKSMLKSLLDTGQGEQAIAYMSRMDEDKRTKVIAEFVKDDSALAANLLERLRTRGINADPASPRPPEGGAGSPIAQKLPDGANDGRSP